jgi:hypothetical protein
MKMLISSILAISLTFTQTSAQSPAHIRVRMEGASKTDTLTLIYWGSLFGELFVDRYMPQIRQTAVIGRDGLFHFDLDSIKTIGYFSLLGRRSRESNAPLHILTNYLIEASDKLEVTILRDSGVVSMLSRFHSQGRYILEDMSYHTQFKISFTGIGSEKYTCRYALDQLSPDTKSYIDSCGRYVGAPNDNDLQLYKSLKLLDTLKGNMSMLAYEVLKANLIAAHCLKKYASLRWRLDQVHIKPNACFNKNIGPAFYAHFLSDSLLTNPISTEAKILSDQFAPYMILKAKMTKDLLFNKDSAVNVLSLIKKNCSGELKEKSMTLYAYQVYIDGIERSGANNVDGESILKECLSDITNPFLKTRLTQLLLRQEEGRPGYNFELPDINGRLIHLSDFKGKAVFIDFWYTGCVNCAGFYQGTLSKVEEKFKNDTNVVFITISIDLHKDTWIKSLKSGEYTSPQAINLFTGEKGAQHPLIEYYNISTYPHPMLFDRQGSLYKATNLRGTAAADELGTEYLVQTINGALGK